MFTIKSALAGVFGLALSGTLGAALPSATTRPHPLAGTWSLEAADDVRPDGSRVPAYGSAPRGLLIVDAVGRYSLQLFRTDRPRFAAGDKRRGTPEELHAAVLGMSSHVGHIEIDSAAKVLTFHIALAQYPNWEGTTQRRSYELVDSVLTYKQPARAGNTNVPLTAWRRVGEDYRPH